MDSLVVIRDCSLIIAALCVRIAAIVERLDIARVELKRSCVVFHSKGVLANLRVRISDMADLKMHE